MNQGDVVPAFHCVNQSGEAVTEADIDRAVLYFYPKAFTPGCTGESCDFRDRWQAFREAGFSIFGVSPDAPEVLVRFRDEYELPFDLLSDPDHAMAVAFDAWGIKKNYGKEYEGLIRSTVVVAEGRIVEAWHNIRAKGHVERVVRQLDL